MKTGLFCAVWLACLMFTSSQTPIPSRPLGYVYVSPGSVESKMVLEIFYDHLCIDSKSNWEFMKNVLGGLEGKDVTAIIHIFPLPYHHNAYFTQQVGVVVRQENPELFKNFIQLIFDNQEKFLSGAVNMTEPEVKKSLASLTSTSLDIAEEKIMSGFDDEVMVEKARYAWKYAASRGITGTPRFIVNGVIAPKAAEFNSVTEWENFIDELIKSPY